MSSFRYWVAVVTIALFLPLLAYWPIVHGFIGVWRRIGVRLSATIVLGALAALILIAGWHGGALILADLGFHWGIVAAGGLTLLGSALLRHSIGKGMSADVLMGFAEIRGESRPARLVRTGIHGRIRHPRYVQLLLAQLGWALVANHLGPYLLLGVWIVAIRVIVQLEERELRARFGEEYARYCREVPRFLPF